jgi:N6-adenosine-specific RNA methylase IME4
MNKYYKTKWDNLNFEHVDKYCVGRKLDYFARKKREGWDVYGDEI